MIFNIKRYIWYSILLISILIFFSCDEYQLFEDDPIDTDIATGSGPYMSVQRSYHTATKMMDGKVLLAGGYSGPAYFYNVYEGTATTIHKSADIYDPETNSIYPTGDLKLARRGHAATLLENGEVLITGGEKVDGYLSTKITNTAEVYNPTTGEFRWVGDMKSPRMYHSSTMLPDGRVLLVGGEIGWNHAEIYDPSTETFSWANPYLLKDRTYSHDAILLDDGRVMIVGGDPGYTSWIEFYDYLNDEIIEGPHLKYPRWLSTATKLNDGRVMIAGGLLFSEEEDHAENSVEIFDPVTNTITSDIPMLGNYHIYNESITLVDGKVLITGGMSRYGESNAVELFDPVTNTFTALGRMNTFRRDHTMTLLDDGNVLIAGGHKMNEGIQSVEVYGLVSNDPGDNLPPYPPMQPYPANNAGDIGADVELSWVCSDPEGNPVTYDVYFGTASDPPLVSSDQSETTYSVSPLELGTEYYWKIVAKDDQDLTSIGPVWSFTTNQFTTFHHSITKIYDVTTDDCGNEICTTPDGGYIIIADSDDYAWLLKTDSNGDTLWTKFLEGGSDGNSISVTSDGGLVAGYGSARVMKMDSNGNEEWQTNNGGAYSVKQTTDGKYITLTRSYQDYSTDIVLLDSNGDYLWLNPLYIQPGYCLQQTADNGFIVTGLIENDYRNAVLLKTDDSGNILWQKEYGGEEKDFGNHVIQTSDGGYLIAGENKSNAAITPGYDLKPDGWLIKTDAAGDTVWTRLVGYGSRDAFLSVQETSDGDFVVAGYTACYGAGGYDAWLLKYDSEGTGLWAATFGTAEDEEAHSVAVDGNNYVITGYAKSGSNESVFIAKVDQNGNLIF